MQQTVDKYQRLVGLDNIVIYPIGRKIAEKVTKLGFNCGGDFQKLRISQIYISASSLRIYSRRNFWMVSTIILK